MFKKFLFKKVKTYIQDEESWGQYEWYNFFKLAKLNYKGPASIWNEEMRSELQTGIDEEITRFKETQSEHIKAIIMQPREKKDRYLTHLTHQYTYNGEIFSSVQHLKWNYQEYSINYSCEKQLCKVWKYYLAELLVEGEFKSQENPNGTKPRLHKDLNPEHVQDLWEHLTMQFIPSNPSNMELSTRKLIMKIMVLLYQNYKEKLGTLKTLPFWLRFIENPRESKLHFLAL